MHESLIRHFKCAININHSSLLISLLIAACVPSDESVSAKSSSFDNIANFDPETFVEGWSCDASIPQGKVDNKSNGFVGWTIGKTKYFSDIGRPIYISAVSSPDHRCRYFYLNDVGYSTLSDSAPYRLRNYERSLPLKLRASTLDRAVEECIAEKVKSGQTQNVKTDCGEKYYDVIVGKLIEVLSVVWIDGKFVQRAILFYNGEVYSEDM